MHAASYTNIKTFYVISHTVNLCYGWISEHTAIISVNSIHLLVFITKTRYVYCAVRTESWNITHISLRLQGLIINNYFYGFLTERRVRVGSHPVSYIGSIEFIPQHGNQQPWLRFFVAFLSFQPNTAANSISLLIHNSLVTQTLTPALSYWKIKPSPCYTVMTLRQIAMPESSRSTGPRKVVY